MTVKSVKASSMVVVGNHDSDRVRSVAIKALPWAALAATSIVYALLQSYDDESNNDFRGVYSRALVEQDDLLASTVLTTNDTSSIYHEHHHHKQIYNEAHKALLPLNASDIYGLVFAVVGLIIAAGGGVGGGGLLVPIYILVMGFTPRQAIPLSNVTVFGGACANVIFNVRKRHPDADRPLVDWDLILVMEPLTIAGALIGAFLNKILPEELLTVLLVLLLSYTAYETLKKAIKMYKKETAQFKASGLRVDGTKESELTLLANKEEDDEAAEALLKNIEDKTVDDDDASNDAETFRTALWRKKQAELDQILAEERETPVANIKILVALFIVVLSINVLKGGGAFRSPLGIKCGSKSFWIANATMLLWIVIITLYVRYHLVKKHERKVFCNFEFLDGDIKWDSRATIVYPIICAAAGLFAGMFGVGGGIVKGPLMLAMGVHPAVSSATSSCMILFTSFTATTSYLVFGLIEPQYSFVCLIVGFLATIAGQEGLSYLMKKSKAQRNSYIAFSIGFVVLFSSILMTFQSLVSLASGEKHRAGGICGKAS